MTTWETITMTVELNLGGSWVDVTTGFVDAESGVQWHRGVSEDRKPQISTASFSMDNSSETWTPGNTASTYYNKLRKGIGVRISSTYSATTRREFTGIVTDIQHIFPTFGPARMRTMISCEGLSSLLAAHKAYGMAAQVNKRVDESLTAIMVAAGSSFTYSFETSNMTLPVVIPTADPLTDLVSVALSEPCSNLFEDGEGRMRWEKMESMVGGHATPDHTWGTTIAPDRDVEPDYRNDSQYARQVVTRSALAAGATDRELYRHPFSFANKSAEAMTAYQRRRISGTFNAFPATVYAKFEQTIQAFVWGDAALHAAINASVTELYTSEASFNQFLKGSIIRIDNEIMLVTSATLANSVNTNQKLTVTRGYLGSVAAAHTAPASPKTVIYHRPMTKVVGEVVGYLVNALAISATTFNLSGGPGGGAPNANVRFQDILQIGSELMTVTSGNALPPVVTRSDYQSVGAAHLAGATAYRVTFVPAGDIVGKTRVLASDQADVPPQSPDIVGMAVFAGGNHIAWVGNKFDAAIYNQANAVRYNSELVISGTVWETTDTPTEIVYEKAIPYVPGMPEGPSKTLPFGTSSIEVAKGWAMGLLRSSRIPSAWLPLTFIANVSDNTSSMLTAEIGDLVRYTGTGTDREKIDDWFRIVSKAGRVTPMGNLEYSFLLAPSHLNRNPAACWYTSFARQPGGPTAGVAGLGAFEVQGVSGAGWTNDSQWYVNLGAGGVGDANRVSAPGVAGPNPPLINVGSGDMVVGMTEDFGNFANNSYAANTGGIGCTFRANSGATQFWEARFNPTTSLIYLWNSTDGVVGTPVAWTATQRPEMEVWARGTQIRVYVDCSGQPAIEATSTRFQTNTYAGLSLERTILGGGGQQPNFIDFYTQAV